MYDIIILSGVSGAGKSYLIQQAIQEYEWLCQIPSITTREPRSGIDESDSRVFLNEKEFDFMIRNDELVFINTVFEKRYAYRYSDIMKAINCGKSILLDMKINTVSQVKKLFPRTLCIYVKVQSQNIEKEIGLDRNNRNIRLREAEMEQLDIEKSDLYTAEIDILFENSIDMYSLNKFKELLARLR